jgi:hypothetical protein
MNIPLLTALCAPRRAARPIIQALLLSAIAAFAACSTIREITEDHSDIRDPHERWQAYHIVDYEFNVDLMLGDDSVTARLYSRVENGRVTIYRDLTHGLSYGKHGAAPSDATIERYFRYPRASNVERVISDSVVYDPRFGFPARAWVVYLIRVWPGNTLKDDTVHGGFRIHDFHALDLDY